MRIVLRRTRAGFTLVEVALAMAILSLLAAAVVPVAIRQVESQLAQRTGREVSLIQDGAKWFYVDQKRWPTSLAELRTAQYLNPAWDTLNPFGAAYTIGFTATTFSVSAIVPAGLEGTVEQLVVTPSTAPAGPNVVVTSTIPVPGRETSLAGYVHKQGDTMTGPLRLDNTYVEWQRGGTTQWRAGLDGANGWSITDGAGANRLGIDRATGQTSMTSVAAAAGTFTSLSASQANVTSAHVSSLTGNTATWTGGVSANDWHIRNIGHWMSEANF
jgi:prepilin-type N-terminal cleavage/methylation domain-containing protein